MMPYQTERLLLRKLSQDDYLDLCTILQDPEVMYAYEGPFTDDEVQDWLDRQLYRYETTGLGLLAIIDKSSGKMIGQCGLTIQNWKDREVLEIGYLLTRKAWHQGYATEAAAFCKDYAFHHIQADSVCSIIRDTNLASQRVAKRNGMKITESWVKHYRGIDMSHLLYTIENQETDIS